MSSEVYQEIVCKIRLLTRQEREQLISVLSQGILPPLENRGDPSVTLEEVRTALSKIPGSMTEDFRRERDER